MDLMEIIQLLGNLGEFLGAFAVFATLLYLAVQVRDASRAAKFAAVQANRAQRIAAFSAMRDSPYLPPILVKIQEGEALNAEDQIRLTSHNSAVWALLYAEWVQRDLGVMGEFATRDEVPMAIVLLSPSAMVLWQNAVRRVYPARFVEYVDKVTGAREAESGGAPADAAAV